MEENKNFEDVSEEVVATEDDLHGENLNDRVRVLSPGMMVAKRFFRSKLSMLGLIMLAVLFIFSFVGPIFSPWSSGGNPVKDETPGLPILSIKTFAYKMYEIKNNATPTYDTQ